MPAKTARMPEPTWYGGQGAGQAPSPDWSYARPETISGTVKVDGVIVPDGDLSQAIGGGIERTVYCQT